MSDDAFLEILAGCTDACANLDLSDDGWVPPVGYYDVMVEDVVTGTKEKNGVNNAWVRVTLQIVDGDFKGRSFSKPTFFWIEPAQTEPSMSIKRLCQLATCLAGNEVRNPIEATEIVRASIDEFINVEVYQTKSKKGQMYTNVRFNQRLDATDATEETPVTAEAQG